MQIIHIDETDSTNRWLRNFSASDEHKQTQASSVRECPYLSDAVVVVADYQTAGRGQGTNTWESERGKNLTFSVLIHPTWVKAARQFILSMVISNAIRRTVEELLDEEKAKTAKQPDDSHSKVEVKWPNDIYVNGCKICGILIENTLKGDVIKDCIMGIGLNVNQRVFRSDAPNPVSLLQLSGGTELNRRQVLERVLQELEHIISHWDEETISREYREHLFRREGVHSFHDADGEFEACIMTVEDDGHLVLQDTAGKMRRYAFKEVTFILSIKQ